MKLFCILALVAFASALPANDRIVGGTDADISDYPWQVSLQTSSHFCGGSIISNTKVLTAAHCYQSTTVYVVMGTSVYNSGGITKTVSSFVQNPNYGNNDYDYAVITIPYTAFTSKIQSIPLSTTPTTSFSSNQQLITTGWGYVSTAGLINTGTTQLQQATLPYVNDADCYWITNYNGAHRVCAGGTGAASSCMGDSGGPLVRAVGSGYQLVGAVSYGSDTCDPAFPGVYADVYAASAWIESQ